MAAHYIGIRASAVLAMAGSALLLVMAGLMLFTMSNTPPPNAAALPIPYTTLLIAMAAVMVAISAWGIATAIGIFQQLRWARISILVFAVLLAFACAISMLAVLLVDLPAQPGPVSKTTMRGVLAVVYGVPTVIGIWWLVLFNRAGAKDYFGRRDAVGPRTRPLSVGIIAWWLLIGGVFVLPEAAMRFPAMLFGAMVTGWATAPLYLAFAVAQWYLGWGLLKLRETARIGAIAYFCFGAANGLVSTLGPGYGKMMRQIQTAMPKLFAAGNPDLMSGHIGWMAIAAAAFVAVPIFFLIRRRPAFH